MEIVEKKVAVIKANDRFQVGVLKSLVMLVKNSYSARELIWQMFVRDFLMQYKKSFLGVAWLFISPLFAIVSWVFMNAVGVLNPGTTGVPYPVYVLMSTMIYGMFTGFMGAGAKTLSSGAAFILQVSYPHEALLIKEAFQYMAQLILSYAFNLIVISIMGVSLRWEMALLPIFAIPFFFIGAGLGLIQAIASQIAADFAKIFGVFTSLVMFITPVLYSIDAIDSNEIVKTIILYNPLTYLVSAPRDLMLTGEFLFWNEFWISTAVSFFIFLIGWRFFFSTERRIVERMG